MHCLQLTKSTRKQTVTHYHNQVYQMQPVVLPHVDDMFPQSMLAIEHRGVGALVCVPSQDVFSSFHLIHVCFLCHLPITFLVCLWVHTKIRFYCMQLW